MKIWVGSVVAALALGGAADLAVARENCSASGVMQAGGGLDMTDLGINSSGAGFSVGSKSGTAGPQAFGELAMLYQCKAWGGQIDGAFYDHWANINTVVPGLEVDLDNPQGHIGGAFWRNLDQGRVGLAGSYIFNSMGVTIPAFGGGRLGSYDTNFFRIGGFAEYYSNEKFTFGIGGFYVGGDSGITINGLGSAQLLNHSGFEGNLSAKYYASQNVSLSLRGDLQLDTADFSPALFVPLSLPLQGYAITAEAEYLVPNTAVSLSVGGRYGYRQLGPLVAGPASAAIYTNDEQAYVAVKFAFGGPKPTSVVQRDRSSGYDNTSVMKEKLPSFVFDLANAGLTP